MGGSSQVLSLQLSKNAKAHPEPGRGPVPHAQWAEDLIDSCREDRGRVLILRRSETRSFALRGPVRLGVRRMAGAIVGPVALIAACPGLLSTVLVLEVIRIAQPLRSLPLVLPCALTGNF